MNRLRRVPLPKISVRFSLRPALEDALGTVRWVARWHAQELFGAPGELVHPALWDADAGRVTRKHPRATYINASLANCEKGIKDAFWSLAGADGHTFVSREAMKAKLYAQATPEPEPLPVGRTMADVRSVWQHENGHLAGESLRKYDQVVKMLDEWRPGLEAADLIEPTVRQYLQYLLTLKLANATIAKHFLFLRIARVQVGLSTRERWLKHTNKNAPQLDLTRDELLALVNLRDLRPDLQVERDMWLFQMCSGRRPADLQRLAPAQVGRIRLPAPWGEVVVLNHVQSKTTADVKVPLPALAIEIGERYDWRFPPIPSQERNERIKKLALKAGLHRPFTERKTSGRDVTETQRPLHRVISSYTARHTCASLLLEFSAVNAQLTSDKGLARWVLGHADEDVTDTYAKDKLRRIAPLILAAWHRILG